MGAKRVLIVDDAYFMRNLIKKVLKEAEQEFEIVGEAKNGKEAITLYFELKPDFVTMDINMPDISGIEATRQILSKDPHAKIIAVTQSDSDEVKAEMIAAGAREYLRKPFQPAFLLSKIDEIFTEKIAPPPMDEEVATSNETTVDDEAEEDFFDNMEINLLSKPDESRDRLLVIENQEDRIEFPEEETSVAEKEKYALIDETSIDLIDEIINEEVEVKIEEEFEVVQTTASADSKESKENVQLHQETTIEEEVQEESAREVLVSTQPERETNPTVVEEEHTRPSQVLEEPPMPTPQDEVPISYMQIRPPRGKVLSDPQEQREADVYEDMDDLVIHASEEEQRKASQKKGMFSFLTNLFKIK